jgi:hypothetical protein
MNFDLNVDNYSRDELISMFDLPPTFDYQVVDAKEMKLRNSIFKNKQLDKDTQMSTILFLTKAKNMILNGNDAAATKSTKGKTPTTNPMGSGGLKLTDALSHFTIKDSMNLLENDTFPYDQTDSIIEGTGPHPIQTQVATPRTSSYPSDFYSGILNPLHKRLVRKNIVIDTRFRDNYYSTSSTNFNLNLPTQFKNVVQMQMTEIEFPFYYYAISPQYGNDFFSITVNGTSTAIVTIPEGNYDPITVTNAVNTALNNLGHPFSQVAFNVQLGESNIISSYLIGNNKMFVGPITGSTLTSIELNFQTDKVGNPDTGTQLPLKLGWSLGFRNGIYTGSMNYISEGVVDVLGAKYVYFVLDDHHNNVVKNFYGLLNASVLNNNILAKFPVFSVRPFNFLVTTSITNTSSPPREFFGPVDIYGMNIQVMDEYGRIINLNNMDYSFTLMLTCIHDL